MARNFQSKISTLLLFIPAVFLVPVALAAPTLGNDIIGGSKYIYNVAGVSIGTVTTSSNALCFSGGCQTNPYLGISQTVTAGNVTTGVFGYPSASNAYSFPAALGVGTTTTAGLPASGLYVAGSVGIGTVSPGSKLTVNGTFNVGDNLYVYNDGNGVVVGASNFADQTLVRGKLNVQPTNGNTALYVNAAGSVGIGTTTPANILNVVKNDDTNGQLRLGPDGTNYTSFIAKSNGDLFIKPAVGAVYFGAFGASNSLQVGGGGSITVNSGSNSTFTGLGNVGIGTTTPGKKLDITGDARVSGRYYWNGTNVSEYQIPSVDGVFYEGTNGTILSMLNSGNVGIGTASPGTPLHINNTTLNNDIFQVTNGATTVAKLTNTDGSNNAGWFKLYSGNAVTIQLAGSGGNSYFNTGGNVGIATTTPGSPLTVAGVVYSSTGGFKFPDGTIQLTAGGGGNSVGWSRTGTNVYLTTSTDSVGIGTSTPASRLEVNGTVKFTNAVNNAASLTWDPTAQGNAGALTAGWYFSYNGYLSQSNYELILQQHGVANNIRFNVGGANTKMIIDSTGNVGVGTTTPTNAKLEIAGTTGTALQIDGGGDFVITSQVTGGNTTLYNDLGVLNVNTGMNILNGNVGVGTTTPASKLYVVAASGSTDPIQAEGSGNFGLRLLNTANTASDYTALRLYQGGVEKGAIYTNQEDMYIKTPGGAGADLFLQSGGGQVGIATTTPNALLSVGTTTTGLVAVFGGGSGKIDAGTIDPPYTIGGEHYATYLPSMTGVKEETAGVAKLQINSKKAYEYSIDFGKAEAGSDLWLFYQTTDFGRNWENLTALLTPNFDGRVWYEKDAKDKKITIYGIPNLPPVAPDSSFETSYRFTAPRFDWQKWPNATGAGGSNGFVLDIKK